MDQERDHGGTWLQLTLQRPLRVSCWAVPTPQPGGGQVPWKGIQEKVETGPPPGSVGGCFTRSRTQQRQENELTWALQEPEETSSQAWLSRLESKSFTI